MVESRPLGAASSSQADDPRSKPETQCRHRRSSFGVIKEPAEHTGPDPIYKHHRRRSSAFFEVGLGGQDAIVDAKIRRSSRPKLQVRFKSKVELVEPETIQWPDEIDIYPHWRKADLSQPPPPTFPTLPRILFLTFVLALLIPSLSNSPLLKAGVTPLGAKAVNIKRPLRQDIRELPAEIARRADSPTDICTRWSQQTAVVNGTLYSYGGRSSTQAGQSENTWNNDFINFDLSQSWQISSPTIKGLIQPSGPPPVANGYLWNSYDALYLYGGEFSDHPATSPVPFSTWSYDISSSSWQQHSNPEVSPGTNSAESNTPVQRAAEGAGVTVPNIGRGFYFGGHLDGYTTEGWSQSIARVYLTSLLEYTFPGYSNPSVLNNQVASSDGIYRNITQGGSQSTAGFPERADGVLVYIPGFGAEGIILGLAGGTNATFTQLNEIDVYDIANSTWYKQATTGPTPPIRVNPCAVAVSAADGSSTQVYMYGGQNLIPYGSQTQYSDVWILSVPSFTWISVDTSTQSVPYARAGLTCNVWNAQMVVVGGYVGTQLSCDSPGIYVFNTSALSWQNEYLVFDSTDPLNRQKAQQHDPNALQGSYGYEVPPLVQSVIGGNALGGATVTAPIETPSGGVGPLATGKPKTYNPATTTTAAVSTILSTTTSNGVAITMTQTTTPPTTTSNGPSTGGSGDTNSSGPNVAAIAAGVVAGFFALLAAYLGFCAWIYRRQLALYKNHVAMAQRAQLSGDTRYIGNLGTSDREKVGTGNGSGRSAEASSANSTTPATTIGGLASNNPYLGAVLGGNTNGDTGGGRVPRTAASSTEDLMAGQEPSFLGVFLNPRRSLRVVNRD